MSDSARGVRAFAPGRTELAGNHTDHQGGRAIAATLDCGIEIEVFPNGGTIARVTSEGFEDVAVQVSGDGMQSRAEGDVVPGTTASLVIGVIDCLVERGTAVKGFDARVRSSIPSGGGLSSSAAFELALIDALQLLFHGSELTAAERAALAVKVERSYFGKPCGYLDQTAIAYGGIVAIDFGGDAQAPTVERIPFDFEACGMAICLIDTHCDHSEYTDEYAQVACDMLEVAQLLGRRSLSEVPEGAFLARFGDVRRELGDLPALRALHYYNEMALVAAREQALLSGDASAFLELTRRSAASSAQYLQNVSTFDRARQPAMVALALADRFAGADGACRIHGGGFGGTVQAFVPDSRADEFSAAVDELLGAGSCRRYRISQEGAHAAWM